MTAEIEVGDKADGMIVTQGGLTGGYGLYLREGRPTFVYNYLDIERYTVASKDALPKGKAKLIVDFQYDGKAGERGKGGKHLLVPPGYNGKLPESGYYVHKASSNRQIVGARSLPVGGVKNFHCACVWKPIPSLSWSNL